MTRAFIALTFIFAGLGAVGFGGEQLHTGAGWTAAGVVLVALGVGFAIDDEPEVIEVADEETQAEGER